MLPGQVARIALTRFISCSSAHFSVAANVLLFGGISAAKRSAVGPPAADGAPSVAAENAIAFSRFSRTRPMAPGPTSERSTQPPLELLAPSWHRFTCP